MLEPALQADIKVGDADAGLMVDTVLLPPPDTAPTSLSPIHITALSSLPSPEVMQARLTAYRKNNARLEQKAHSLRSRSTDLEAKLKKVVGLCTGVGEQKVDGIVAELRNAVEAERGEDVEVGRIREFLRRVEESGELGVKVS